MGVPHCEHELLAIIRAQNQTNLTLRWSIDTDRLMVLHVLSYNWRKDKDLTHQLYLNSGYATYFSWRYWIYAKLRRKPQLTEFAHLILVFVGYLLDKLCLSLFGCLLIIRLCLCFVCVKRIWHELRLSLEFGCIWNRSIYSFYVYVASVTAFAKLLSLFPCSR